MEEKKVKMRSLKKNIILISIYLGKIAFPRKNIV